MRLTNQQVSSIAGTALRANEAAIAAEKKELTEAARKALTPQAKTIAAKIKSLPSDAFEVLMKKKYSDSTRQSYFTQEAVLTLLMQDVNVDDKVKTKKINRAELEDRIHVASVECDTLAQLSKKVGIAIP